ncbi:MAG: ATP-dependent zinc metalloprotease FtsH [Oscillospiraceae bacterium]|jgi:cell division protease FtsH|nr:ATP-dependent zinc metalloprotease FtsH [Oscillospiraceae bacterium]
MIALVAMSQFFWTMNPPTDTNIDYNDLLSLVQNQQVERVALIEDRLVGLKRNSRVAMADFPGRFDFQCVIDRDRFFETVKLIRAKQLNTTAESIGDNDFGFIVDYLQPAQTPWYFEFLPYLVVMVIMAAFWMFIMRQQQGGNSKVMSFGKTKTRIADPTNNKIRFPDVAGADEEKEELREIVEFLKNPRRFTDIGARIPKGVLLVGPPGTGKTLLAKAVAGEAGVPFFSISGSDFVEMFVGVGASRVRDLFEQAKRHSPSIVFIDEIDAVGRHRGAGLGGGHDEREQTLNQLLVEMDGFSTNEGVIVLAATNRRDILDPALLRPGRFDRQITVNYPDVQGRIDILKVHSKGKPLAEDVDLSVIARRTPLFTGADLENVMNEAAILTARAGEKKIYPRFLEEAITRVEMGPEKRSRRVSARDRRIVAYHEAGHAIVGMLTPDSDEVHMVTIVPRGESGGHTQYLPDENNSLVTRKQLLAKISMTLGGRAAEMLEFGDITTGATSDIQHATALARRMITQFGMSDDIGPVYLGGDQEVFLGRDFTQSRTTSEVVAAKIDECVHDTITNAESRAVETLTRNRDKLTTLAELLLDRETVDKEVLDAIREGRAIPAMKPKEVPRPPEEPGSPLPETVVAPALIQQPSQDMID